MKVLFDVDIEVAALRPSAPVIGEDRVVCAGGDGEALLASCDRRTGTVCAMAFAGKRDVDVSAPVALDDNHVAAAVLDPHNVELHVMLFDRDLRMRRARDIACDDDVTPPAVFRGTLEHFTFSYETPVVAVASEKDRVVRALYDDLTPRWALPTQLYGVTDDVIVLGREWDVVGRSLLTGDELWRGVPGYEYFNELQPRLMAVGSGNIVVVLDPAPDFEYGHLGLPEIVRVDARNNARYGRYEVPVGEARVTAVHHAGDMLASLTRAGRHVLFFAGCHTPPSEWDAPPRIIERELAVVGGALVHVRPEDPTPRQLALDLSDDARACCDDDNAYIRDGRRLLAVSLSE